MSRLLAVLVAAACLCGCDPTNVAEAIHRFFPDREQDATRIARCESNFQPAAVSPDHLNWGTMQINVVHAEQFERVTGQPFHDGVLVPHFNLMFARWLYEQSGNSFRAWSCS